jgi:hypothetical protein
MSAEKETYQKNKHNNIQPHHSYAETTYQSHQHTLKMTFTPRTKRQTKMHQTKNKELNKPTTTNQYPSILNEPHPNNKESHKTHRKKEPEQNFNKRHINGWQILQYSTNNPTKTQKANDT